ncbi:MAG: hypothetical protein H6510_15975 [Acidobacteria bacterium]|nr:hypothetical protein [Acidobacteriota bacterium]
MCFVCFEDLESGKFHVQSADFYDATREDSQYLNDQKLTLFRENPPNLRTEGYDSLSLAIEAHEQAFSE